MRVPEDLSVVGFDGIEAAAWTSPALTTVEQPIDERSAYLVPHSRITGPSLWYEYETTEFNRFKIQYSHHDTDFLFADNRKADDALFVEWTVTVGPHGAHKY